VALVGAQDWRGRDGNAFRRRDWLRREGLNMSQVV
jgi:hypothetical protein